MTTRFETVLAEDVVVVTGVVNGDVVPTKLSEPKSVSLTLSNTSLNTAGTAVYYGATLNDNRTATINLVNIATGGTAFVTFKGRL